MREGHFTVLKKGGTADQTSLCEMDDSRFFDWNPSKEACAYFS